MVTPAELTVQYITDEQGRRRAVVLSIEQFEELLDDLADLATLAERRDESTIAHTDLVVELKRDGLLPG
jgi:hypothetical protein